MRFCNPKIGLLNRIHFQELRENRNRNADKALARACFAFGTAPEALALQMPMADMEPGVARRAAVKELMVLSAGD